MLAAETSFSAEKRQWKLLTNVSYPVMCYMRKEKQKAFGTGTLHSAQCWAGLPGLEALHRVLELLMHWRDILGPRMITRINSWTRRARRCVPVSAEGVWGLARKGGSGVGEEHG